MSLTQTELLFGSINETAINDLLNAFFTARPRYLHYATSAALLPPGTAFITVPPIAFPGIATGIQYGVSFSLPTLDINPDSSGGADPIPPGASQFTIHTKMTLTVVCVERRPNIDIRTHVPFSFVPINTDLDVFARGHLILMGIGSGAGTIGFQIDDVELVDVKPDSLESVLECLAKMLIQAVLSNIQVPVENMLLGTIPFPIHVIRGPLAETDQAKVFANL